MDLQYLIVYAILAVVAAVLSVKLYKWLRNKNHRNDCCGCPYSKDGQACHHHDKEDRHASR